MKMDKESLAKNRFWIGLIAFGPIWLLVFVIALFSSGTQAEEKAKEIKGARDAVTAISRPVNERFTTLIEAKEKDLKAQKDKVWAEAWKGQKDLMKWPDGMDGKAQLEAGYFGDPLTPAQRSQFRDVKNYYAELPKGDISKNEPGMQLWLYPITADWDKLIHRADFNKTDKDLTDEEVWLAQEDIWVQQEMLSIVRSALESASRFEDV
ncbi:MAG TPA: hypothetical protein VFW33_14635, partial [Gemmataceae bacterium]|nr:hypothetical protein [Gemmataceae bacterium]